MLKEQGDRDGLPAELVSYGSKFLTLLLVLVIKNLPANAGVIRRHRFDSWVRNIP